MSYQPPEKSSFQQRYADAAWLARYPAMTILPLLRRDLGFRLLNPGGLFVMNGILALIAMLAIPEAKNAGPLALLMFAILSFISGMSQRVKRWREFNNGVHRHTYYIGTSRLQFAWLPQFFLRNRRAARFLDPLLCIIVGCLLAPLLPALGLWLIIAGVCLRAYEDAVFIRQRNRDMDIHDGLIIAERNGNVIQHVEQVPPGNHPPQGAIPAGIDDDIAEQIRRRKMKNNSAVRIQPAVTRTATASGLPANTANQQQTKKKDKKMNTTNIPGTVWKQAYELADKMPPLKVRKHPGVAAAIGFAFGGLGLALYFGTILDFVVPFCILLLVFLFGIPTGELALLLLPPLCAIWGYRRAVASNAKLDAKAVTVPVVPAPSMPEASALQRN